MPKKSKTEETNAAVPAEPVTSAVEAQPSTELKKPTAKKTSTKKATGTKSAIRKPAAKKSATRTAKKPAAKKSATTKAAAGPTDEDIRIRAYFIAERRMQMSLDGDPNNDWIQAREELLAENSNGSANGNGSHQS